MKMPKLNDIIEFKNNKTLLHKILNKYIISKQEKSDIIKSLENVANDKTLITFYYDDVEYTAEKGMTWFDFCKSEYNVDEWFTGMDYMSPYDYITTYDPGLSSLAPPTALSHSEGDVVIPTEIVLENYRYKPYVTGGSSGN